MSKELRRITISYILLMALLSANFMYNFAVDKSRLVQIQEILDNLDSTEGRVEAYETNYSKIKEELDNTHERINEMLRAETTTVTPPEPTEAIKEEMKVPSIPTNVKLFTDYRAYNLWYTPHYRLQQAAWTDEQGFRRFNEDYIVALGSYYSTDIGDRFEVTLDTGVIFTVVLGDGKWDTDCDALCMYTPCVDLDGRPAGNLLEFIIDEDVLDKEIYRYGSLDKLDKFKGSITKMVYLGRDNSADWDTYETVKGEANETTYS